jgi:tetratricopeptide (TPR) repeat protein
MRRARVALVVGTFVLIGPLASCSRGPVPPDLTTLGQLDPAVQTLVSELTAGVNANRTDAAAWGKLAMGFEANGLLLHASEAYAVAVGLDDREPRWRYRQALLQARRGELDAALANLERVIALAPSYAPARWRQGLWLLDRGDATKAESAFRVAVQTAPTDPAGTIGLALVHLSKRQDEEAAALLERLLVTTPGERYALQLLGTAYRRTGREDEARFALTVGSTGQPVWTDPWSDEIAQYRRGFPAMLKEATQLGLERRFDQAITLLRQLCALRPDDQPLRVYLGGMYASAGRVDEAVAILDPILAANPNEFDATMHLASGYLFAGALDKAAVYASRALALRPSSADAAKLRGVVHWQEGRSREAETFFEASAAADPRDPMPHLWMGMILGQQAKYGDARRSFETALSKNPLLGDAQIGVADTYAAVGAFAEAQAAIARAVQIEPGNPRLAAARERIDAASKATNRASQRR